MAALLGLTAFRALSAPRIRTTLAGRLAAAHRSLRAARVGTSRLHCATLAGTLAHGGAATSSLHGTTLHGTAGAASPHTAPLHGTTTLHGSASAPPSRVTAAAHSLANRQTRAAHKGSDGCNGE